MIDDTAVLAHTINAFLSIETINWVIPVIGMEHGEFYRGLNLKHEKLLLPITGDIDRQGSILAGLEALEARDPDLVLIHDGARPFVTRDLVKRICERLLKQRRNDGAFMGVLPAMNPTDAMKFSTDGITIENSLNRDELWAAQTPQGFYFSDILKAHREARNHRQRFNDDSSLAEWAGMKVAMIKGDPDNFKITLNSDFLRARAMLKQNNSEAVPMETRVGSGLDIHQFENGKNIRLGGIDIPHTMSLRGHSDADAALHVLTDALLGALAEGDIGTHFPPSEKKWKGEPSDTFLRFATDRVLQRGGRILHLDLTIVCEEPKIGPHSQHIRENIARICSVSPGRVSLKATTSENMGFVGRAEGLMTMGTATIELPAGEK